MVKIDIISGFLGAGKTTFINKLIESINGVEKLAIIENEYGKIGIDGDILRKSEIKVKDITAGCICCSLAEDLDKALEEIYHEYKPDRIIIEPTGIGKLSDIVKACQKTRVSEYLQINSLITIVNVLKFEVLNASFGDFFHNQIQNAHTILFSRTQKAGKEKIDQVVQAVRNLNIHARIITSPWEDMDIISLLNDKDIEGEKAHDCSCECGCSKNHSQKGHGHSLLDTWGTETGKVFERESLIDILHNIDKFGHIVRGKGFLSLGSNKGLKFDYVQGELSIKDDVAEGTGKVSFIGENLDVEGLSRFFAL